MGEGLIGSRLVRDDSDKSRAGMGSGTRSMRVSDKDLTSRVRGQKTTDVLTSWRGAEFPPGGGRAVKAQGRPAFRRISGPL